MSAAGLRLLLLSINVVLLLLLLALALVPHFPRTAADCAVLPAQAASVLIPEPAPLGLLLMVGVTVLSARGLASWRS